MADKKISPRARMTPGVCERLILAAQRLRDAVGALEFSSPVSFVYNPLHYAWAPYEAYLRRYARTRKRVVFLGMNPGPFGMVQTGVPFGEVAAVRDWLRISGAVGKPGSEHPSRPVSGFACPRSEVSGRRLWGFVAERFGTPQKFFEANIVMNYCPLAFLEAGGRNRTPDKLPSAERADLYVACDEHLRRVVDVLQPEWVIGIGGFARERAAEALQGRDLKLDRILHPSPASPASNRDWAGAAARQLREAGVW